MSALLRMYDNKMLVLLMMLLGLVHVAGGQGVPDQLLQTWPTAAGGARPLATALNKDPVVSDFSVYGGAASYLASMEDRQVQGLLRQAGWSKAELVKKLDSDPELVGADMLETS
jgi:hypothetical protein